MATTKSKLKRGSGNQPATRTAKAKTKKEETVEPDETKKEEAQEESKTRTLTSARIDPARVAAMANQAKAYSGGGGPRVPYLKLTGGKNYIRILPPETEEESWVFAVRQNTERQAGRFFTMMELGFVFGNEELHERALKAGKITKLDFERFQQYGDPYVETMKKLKDAEIKLPSGRSFWPTSRYYMNVVNREDGQVYLWEASNKAFQAIQKKIGEINEEGEFVPGEYPELLDPEEGFDLLIEGNGQDGNARRYDDPIPVRASSPIGEVGGERTDFIEVALGKVVSWETRARAVLTHYGEFAQKVGVTAKALGLSSIDASEDDGEA